MHPYKHMSVHAFNRLSYGATVLQRTEDYKGNNLIYLTKNLKKKCRIELILKNNYF